MMKVLNAALWNIAARQGNVAGLESVMSDTSKEVAKRLAETLRGEHGFAFIGYHAIEAANTIDALAARVAELEDAQSQMDMPTREEVAKEIYKGMVWAFNKGGETTACPEWVDGGNSLAQDEARRIALRLLDSFGLVFSDTDPEAQYIDDCENACPLCMGSGHKDDTQGQTVASLADNAPVDAYLVTNKEDGKTRVIDASKWDPTKPEFWITEHARATHKVEALYPLSAITLTSHAEAKREGMLEAAKMLEAIAMRVEGEPYDG